MNDDLGTAIKSNRKTIKILLKILRTDNSSFTKSNTITANTTTISGKYT